MSSLWRFIPSYVFSNGNGILTYQIVNIGRNLELKELEKYVILDEVNCNQRKNIEFKRWIFVPYKRERDDTKYFVETDIGIPKRHKGELEMLHSIDNDDDDEYDKDNSSNSGMIPKKHSIVKAFMNSQE